VRRAAAAVAGAFLLALAVPGISFAHGDLQGTNPEDGSKIGSPPKEVTISLTEAPTRGAEARASDGCKRRVPAAVSVDGNDIVMALEGGEPGKWKVSYQAVSAVDGHRTRGEIAFSVGGEKDCSRNEPEDEVDAADDPGIVENPNPPDEGISWLIWVAVGTVVVAGIAFVLRRAGH
jgi:copper resistance protein C